MVEFLLSSPLAVSTEYQAGLRSNGALGLGSTSPAKGKKTKRTANASNMGTEMNNHQWETDRDETI